MEGSGMRRGVTWWLGVFLGFAGALLDFYSGYLIITQSTTGEMGMVGGSNPSGLIWGTGIVALGIVLAATAFIFLLPGKAGKMNDYGALMVVYGLVMFFIGGVMYSGLTSMTTGAFVPAVGMFAVGALMVGNGALMLRSYTRRMMP